MDGSWSVQSRNFSPILYCRRKKRKELASLLYKGSQLVSPAQDSPGERGKRIAAEHEADGAGLGGVFHGVGGACRLPFLPALDALSLDFRQLARVFAALGLGNGAEVDWTWSAAELPLKDGHSR